MGRPYKETAEALEKRVAAYFDDRAENGMFPTESGMMLHLGLYGEKLKRYLADKDYAGVWERAEQRRTDWLENRMVTEGKSANGCMNALKQQKNGGYADRSAPEKKTRSQFLIKLGGVGKGAAE